MTKPVRAESERRVCRVASCDPVLTKREEIARSVECAWFALLVMSGGSQFIGLDNISELALAKELN